VTVRKGEAWGSPGPLPDGAPVAPGDRDLALAAAAVLGAGGATPTFGLTGGDLHRTLGSPPGERMSTPEAMRLPVDLVRAVLDGEEHWFVAHLVAARGPWFRHRTVVVMNAAFVGDANLGPRAHPGDGLVDVTDGRLGFSDRRAARARMGAGAHLPHPGLTTRRAARYETELDRPTPVRLDGELVGRFRTIAVEVRPDALVVVV
jgi:hypothetical protein